MNAHDEFLDSSQTDLFKQLFDEIDENRDQRLSFTELNTYLSKKAGKTFNNQLLLEIFRTMDHDQNSMITLNEFIQGYSTAEKLIKTQISQLSSQLAENSENLSQAQRSLLESKSKIFQNTGENNLFINIKKAENLYSPSITGNKAPIVIISCESNKIQTNPSFNPVNPE